MLQRWQGPDFTFVRVISMKPFVSIYSRSSQDPIDYCLFYGLSTCVLEHISRLNSDIH